MNKLLRFLVTGMLLGWIGWKTEWDKVQQGFAHLEVGYWLAAVGVLLASQIVSAARWKVFADQLGMRRTLRQLTGYYFIGMYFNLLLPTSVGGDVVRAWFLNARSGRKLRSVAAVLLDRLNGLGVLVMMACVGALFLPPEMPSWIGWSVAGIAAAGMFGVLSLLAIRHLGLLPANRVQQFNVMWEVVGSPRSLIATTLLSAVVQLANAALVWLIAQGLGSTVPFSYYAVLVPMVSLLTLLPISVNGMGIREEATVLFLAPWGVAKEMALTLALLWFAAHLAASMLGGLVYLFGHFPKPNTGTNEKEVEDGSVDRDPDQGREGQLGRAA